MTQIATNYKFKISEDVTFIYNSNPEQVLFLTLIEIENDKCIIEVTTKNRIVGRQLILSKSTASYAFRVFKMQLESYKYYSEVFLCLNLAFSHKTNRATILVMRLYGRMFHHSQILRLRDRFDLEFQWAFDNNDDEDKMFKPVSIEVNLSKNKKRFGYFRGSYMRSDYRFHFYP
jgi:hypothetical protein